MTNLSEISRRQLSLKCKFNYNKGNKNYILFFTKHELSYESDIIKTTLDFWGIVSRFTHQVVACFEPCF